MNLIRLSSVAIDKALKGRGALISLKPRNSFSSFTMVVSCDLDPSLQFDIEYEFLKKGWTAHITSLLEPMHYLLDLTPGAYKPLEERSKQWQEKLQRML